MNSQLERSQLAETLSQRSLGMTYFDEPSALRRGGPTFVKAKAFQNWLLALDQKVQESSARVLVAHSFGALAVAHYLRLFKSRLGNLKAILLISPTLDLNRVFRWMMEVSAQDHLRVTTQVSPQKSRRLLDLLDQSKELFDTPMQEGLDLVWQNPSLLSHYFQNAEAERAWVNAYSQEGYGLDFESQEAVLLDFCSVEKQGEVGNFTGVPLHLLFGDLDPVFDLNEARSQIMRRGGVLESETVAVGSGHFPHIEHPELFCQLLKKILGDA